MGRGEPEGGHFSLHSNGVRRALPERQQFAGVHPERPKKFGFGGEKKKNILHFHGNLRGAEIYALIRNSSQGLKTGKYFHRNERRSENRGFRAGEGDRTGAGGGPHVNQVRSY